MLTKFILLALVGLLFLAWSVLVLTTVPINGGQLVFMLVVAVIGLPAILSVRKES